VPQQVFNTKIIEPHLCVRECVERDKSRAGRNRCHADFSPDKPPKREKEISPAPDIEICLDSIMNKLYWHDAAQNLSYIAFSSVCLSHFIYIIFRVE